MDIFDNTGDVINANLRIVRNLSIAGENETEELLALQKDRFRINRLKAKARLLRTMKKLEAEGINITDLEKELAAEAKSTEED